MITDENREFVNKDGNLVEIKFETETKGGNIKIKREIIVEGKGVQSELEISEKFEGGEVKLKAPLSDGREQEIKIMPDKAFEIASETLSINNFSIEIREVGSGSDIKAVYLVKGDKPGKLLGLFDVNLAVEVQIDPETGDIIRYSKPWWAFLVFEFDEVAPNKGFINETNETGTIGDLSVSLNETVVFNETIVNETIVNNTVINDTIVNDTISNDTVVNNTTNETFVS